MSYSERLIEAPKFFFVNRNLFLFYVVVPVLLGLLYAFTQSGDEPLDGISGYLVYWVVSVFVSWQLTALATAFVAQTLRPFRTPLIVVLALGFAVGICLWIPVSTLRDTIISGVIEEGQTVQGYSRLSDLATSLANWIHGATVWVGVNYFFLYAMGMNRFGYQPDSNTVKKIQNWIMSNTGKDYSVESDTSNDPRIHDEHNATPRLSKRLQGRNSGDILALIAEDHYTRVVMPDKEELVYIRFGDAMSEMEGVSGFQVHRSYWVNLNAIEHYQERGHQAFIRLSKGETIPVSRSFRQSVKNHLKLAQ